MKCYVYELAKTIVRNLSTLNKTLLFGVILFSSGVIIYVVAGNYLSGISSDTPLSAPFPPGEVVSDSCMIEQPVGYLSLRVEIRESTSARRINTPAHLLVQGPDNKVLRSYDSVGGINHFYGSQPAGTYLVTVTNQEQNELAAREIPIIQYELVCYSKQRYDLGQSLGGILALANLMYLVGLPIMIYGIVKERRIRKRESISREYWKSRVQKRKSNRPLGVTALSIDSIFGAVILFLSSLVFAAVSSVEDSSIAWRQEFSNVVREAMPFPLDQLDFAALAGLSLGLGVLSIVEGYGLLHGKRWAWTLAVLLSSTSIATSVVFFAFEPDIASADAISSLVIGVGISGIIIYYLYKPKIRSYFGRLENFGT